MRTRVHTESPKRHGLHHPAGTPMPIPLATPRRRRWPLALCALALAGGLWWQGQQRVPGPPAAGTALPGHAVAASQGEGPANRLRIGTFNIHGCKGLDRVRDLDRIAGELRGCDVVGLNEVHGPYFWQQQDQAQRLGETLDMDWLFAPTETRWWSYRFGNGLLSRLPVRWWQQVPLPRVHGKGYRNMILGTVDVGGRPVQLLVTHIDRSDPRERAEQLRAAGDLFLSLAEPAVMLGDLNTDATEPALRRLLDAPGVVDCIGQALGSRDVRRIDWILARGLRVIDGSMLPRGASDHPHLWAELELID